MLYEIAANVKMDHNQIFKQTMPFVWAKLILGLISVAVSVVLFIFFAFMTWVTKGYGVIIFFLLWLGATSVTHFVITKYFGYLVKAGHVAVVTEAVTSGKVPENQIEYGKDKVKERFISSNVFFLIDKLVNRSVTQLQNVFGKAGGFLLGALPGAGILLSFGKLFISISLKYVDECCLGWIFHNKEQKAFKSAVDGVVIYAQNWKALLKTAFKTSFIVIGLSVVLTIVTYSVLGGLFRFVGLSGLWGFAIFLLAVYLTIIFKRAFIDSYMMVRMMTTYMQVAPTTEISFDLYGKLAKVSKSFKELFKKSQDEKADHTPPVQSEPDGIQSFNAAYSTANAEFSE